MVVALGRARLGVTTRGRFLASSKCVAINGDGIELHRDDQGIRLAGDAAATLLQHHVLRPEQRIRTIRQRAAGRLARRLLEEGEIAHRAGGITTAELERRHAQ